MPTHIQPREKTPSHPETHLRQQYISIIMPVYNGEKYIASSITRTSRHLRKCKYNHEIIIVDDGSKDKTRENALKTAANLPNIKILGYNKNQGKGAAFLHGYKHAEGNIIVLFDADLDIQPQQIPILLKTMEKTRADIVITNKWHPKSPTKASTLRKLLSRSYNTLVRLLTGLNLNDTQTGAKAMKKQVLDTVTPKMYVKRYAFDVELLLLAAKQGYKITEAPSIKPIKLKTPFKPREILNMLLELLSITYRHGRL